MDQIVVRGDAGNVIGGDDCVGGMVTGNLVTVTVPQGQAVTEDFKFLLVLTLQTWDMGITRYDKLEETSFKQNKSVVSKL